MTRDVTDSVHRCLKEMAPDGAHDQKASVYNLFVETEATLQNGMQCGIIGNVQHSNMETFKTEEGIQPGCEIMVIDSGIR
ncbi:6-phospho-5-dehydro-2-deoxy-D-gluconate aldolase [Trichinella pseudospiralis]